MSEAGEALPTVAFVVLAAGGSRRLGSPKQLLPVHGTTLLRRAVETALEVVAGPAAAGTGFVIVVLGCEADRMRAELEGLPVRIAVNERWAEGLSGSIRTGIQAATAGERASGPRRRSSDVSSAPVQAAVLLTCDQPFVTASLLGALVAAFRAGAPLVACADAGTLGVPALFGHRFFPELVSLEGDAGAKRVIERHRDVVATVPFEQGEADVDEVEDAEAERA